MGDSDIEDVKVPVGVQQYIPLFTKDLCGFILLPDVLSDKFCCKSADQGSSEGQLIHEAVVPNVGLLEFLIPSIQSLAVDQDTGVGVKKAVLMVVVFLWEVIGENLPDRTMDGVNKTTSRIGGGNVLWRHLNCMVVCEERLIIKAKLKFASLILVTNCVLRLFIFFDRELIFSGFTSWKFFLKHEGKTRRVPGDSLGKNFILILSSNKNKAC